MAKKKDIAEQPALVLKPAAPEPARVETSWEYSVAGDPWRAWKAAELTAEFGVTEAEMAEFQTVVSGLSRQWLMVRRLYGLVPVLPLPGTPPEDLKPWGAAELAESLSITRAQLQQELDVVRGHWEGRRKTNPPGKKGGTGVEPVPTGDGRRMGTGAEPAPTAPGELALTTPEEVLAACGFSRIKFVDAAEWERFRKRLEELGPLLREAASAGLARDLLMTELRIGRIDADLNDPSRTAMGAEWRAMLKTRTELADSYESRSKLVLEQFPWAQQVAGKLALKGTVTEIVAAIQAYQARGDTALVDGIHTLAEVEVLCRMSVQAPLPKYRAGKVVYLNEARAGLWDPKWQSGLTHGLVKRLDKVWAEAYAAASREAGDPLVDLEKDGKEGEYPGLQAGGKGGVE